jgi:hypothetical protein
MSESKDRDREWLVTLIENLSDANAQRVLIYIQGLQAGQKIMEDQKTA